MLLCWLNKKQTKRKTRITKKQNKKKTHKKQKQNAISALQPPHRFRHPHQNGGGWGAKEAIIGTLGSAVMFGTIQTIAKKCLTKLREEKVGVFL